MAKYSILGSLQYFLDPSHTRLGIKIGRSCFWNKDDLKVDLRGKVAVVTGANAGIGRATAHALAMRGGQIHMLCRSEERGTEARNFIRRDSGNEEVHLHIVDLAEPPQIQAFVEDFKSKNKKVDILVNNAAVMPNELKITKCGLESAFATNLCCFYGFTKSMLPLLSKGARIVNVVSAGMYASKLDMQTIEKGLTPKTAYAKKYDGLSLYSQHHRARVILSDYFAEQFGGEGVTVNCVHPGWVDTPGLASAKAMESFYKAVGSWLRSEEEGADTVVWLALAEKAKKHTGEYFFDRKARSKHKCFSGTRSSLSDVDKLVQTCEKGFSRM